MNKRRYLKEVEKIHKLRDNAELRAKMDQAYDLYNKIHKLTKEEKDRSHKLVREILEGFFKDQFTESYSIPIEFIESEIGRILFSLKFGIAEREYTASEVTAIMDITRALISHDRKNRNLKSTEKGRNTFILESELIKYMKSKYMTDDEINERLSMFAKLKLEGLDNEDIKVKIREHIKAKYKV